MIKTKKRKRSYNFKYRIRYINQLASLEHLARTFPNHPCFNPNFFYARGSGKTMLNLKITFAIVSAKEAVSPSDRDRILAKAGYEQTLQRIEENRRSMADMTYQAHKDNMQIARQQHQGSYNKWLEEQKARQHVPSPLDN